MKAQFKTSDGEMITGERLEKALKDVADDYRRMEYKIFEGNDYADHVRDETKKAVLEKGLSLADDIESGIVKSFGTWQRINEKITGKCIPFLPPNKKQND